MIKTVPIPNLSLLLPGDCNAACSFCSWHHTEASERYVERVREVLDGMPPQFVSLSLTGGEPLLSPVLRSVLRIIDRQRWKRVGITTNGSRPPFEAMMGKLDFANISRHHYDDELNRGIFRSPLVPDASGLRGRIQDFGHLGVKVSLNCVLSKWLPAEHILAYVRFARSIGAETVCFRKPHGPSTDSSPAIQELWCRERYGDYTEYPCPVCRTASQIIDGFPVKWKSGVAEPTLRLGTGEWYEAILHPSGQLSGDWSEQTLAEPSDIEPREEPVTEDEINRIADIVTERILARLPTVPKKPKGRPVKKMTPRKKTTSDWPLPQGRPGSGYCYHGSGGRC